MRSRTGEERPIMIDPTVLVEDFEATARRLGRRGVDRATLERARVAVEQRKRLISQLDEQRARMNQASREIGILLRDGRQDEAAELRQRLIPMKNAVLALEDQLREVEDRVSYELLRIPNFPADDCPDGQGEQDNVVLRSHGKSEDDYRSKRLLPHWEVAGRLGIYDGERSAKLSGSMFALLRGDGARLLHALVQFGLDLNRSQYEEVLPPHFVRSEIMLGTGHLPKFEAEAYKLRDDDLWAIPTGEVPLMGLHRDEILQLAELPKRYMAYTVCFRREAGSAGKDTRGLQRVHEFHKVELLKLCAPEQVQTEFEGLLADAERPLQLLDLPYRVVDLCAGDLTFSSARIFDLEVYAPGVDRWLEVSSVGMFTDFQARRSSIRFRRKDGAKPEFVHALNGSALATPRIWAAIIEHGQQPDGSVRIPEPLVPYLGREVIGP
jgi:seryl-tRNA synthetase